jgi:Flp pilus assembly protein TadD
MRIPTLLEGTTPATPLGELRRADGGGDVAAGLRSRVAMLAIPERAIPLAIVLAVVAVFAVGLHNDFVQWDDQKNLVENEHFRGLGPRQLGWMFTTTLLGHCIPLTWLTFGLDYVLWGMHSAGYHFTNLVLHAANAVLVYWLGKRLLAAARPAASETALRAGAAAAALFFAVHPLRAESVAWATERRDVLSGLLFLACVLTYLRAVEAGSARRRRLLALAVVLFALAMLAKSIVMTLPLLLLVLDAYPLRRLSAAAWRAPDTRRVLLEKAPFAVVAALGAGVSYWAVAHQDFFTPAAKYPLPSRIAMAFYSMAFYISKTVLPTDLSPLYELPPRVNPLDSEFALAIVAVALVTVTLVALAPRWPAGLAAYGWYAIMLAPVGGLVHAGFQLAHDRYSYLSCLGFALLVGGGVVWLVGARTAGALRPALFRACAAALGALLVSLAGLTWLQVQVWRDSESLWTHATIVTPECSICHDNYGASIVNREGKEPGEVLVAIEHFTRALVLKPERDKPYGGLGLALIQLNRPREAEGPLRRAVAKIPKDAGPADAGPLNNLGLVLSQQGRFAEAEPFLRRAVALNQRPVVARANLGGALAGLGRYDDAIAEFQRAATAEPFAPEPRIGLVLAYRDTGNAAEMRKHLTILRQLHPDTARSVSARHGL